MPSPGADSDAARLAHLDGAPGLRHRGSHFMHHVHDGMTTRPWRSKVEHLSMAYLCICACPA